MWGTRLNSREIRFANLKIQISVVKIFKWGEENKVLRNNQVKINIFNESKIIKFEFENKNCLRK